MNTLEALQVRHEVLTDARVKTVRETLPRQAAHGKSQLAAAQFGLLMSAREIHQRIASILPKRGTWRSGAMVAGAVMLLLGTLLFVVGLRYDVTACSTNVRGTLTTEQVRRDCLLGRAMMVVLGVAGIVGGCAIPPCNRRRRTTQWHEIEAYNDLIPDAALLKYGNAVQSGLFSKFWVVEPAYEERHVATIDPWLVGRVIGIAEPMWLRTHDAKGYVVLAYWE